MKIAIKSVVASFLFFIVILLGSCSGFKERSPSSSTKPKHYVITMHGVRGNAESFGEFHTFVSQVLSNINNQYTYVPINWTYPVGKAVDETKPPMNPHLIAKKFNYDMFLKQNAEIPVLNPEDKISIIAYSMGGQMVLSWYYNTMFNFKFRPEYKYSPADLAITQKALSQVENIIGLGPVYWGSLDAEIGWTYLENGDLTEVKKTIPVLEKFCASEDVQFVTQGRGAVANAAVGVKNTVLGWFGVERSLTDAEKKQNTAENLLINMCSSVKNAGPKIAEIDLLGVKALPLIKGVMKSLGNMNASEMDHMRLTSDIINEMRLMRIDHLNMNELKNRYKAKFTSIVGVFPCLGKKDQGLTCKEFETEGLSRINRQLTTIFSGLVRRETDGPVIGPSAVADFIYYIEPKNSRNKKIEMNQFFNTFEQTQETSPSHEIFVENMHATVVPAIEALSFLNLGKDLSLKILDFDKALGVDVVIMNKECATPNPRCVHPNFKNVIETISGCSSEQNYCNQKYLNQYFRVSEMSQRHLENQELKKELGTFTIMFNIRLPLNYPEAQLTKDVLLSKFKFIYSDYSKTNFEERFKFERVDFPNDPFGVQINRRDEILKSHAYIRRYNNSKVARVFFMGRAWPKKAQDYVLGESGVPVRMRLELPGLGKNEITIKVKPTYTTYIDLNFIQ